MRKVTVDSLGVPDLVEVQEFESIPELEKEAGKEGVALKLCNLYLRQKGALVAARDKIVSHLVATYKFPLDPTKVKREEKMVDGVKKVFEKNTETEGDYIARFKRAVFTGGIAGFSKPDEISFNAAMVATSRKLGPWVLSAKEAERQLKEKTPPQYALNGAAKIIENGSQAKWITTFTKEGISYEDFQQSVPKGPEGEVVRKQNLHRLAWAIKAREDAKAGKEYI